MRSKANYGTKRSGFGSVRSPQAGSFAGRGGASYLTPDHRGGLLPPLVESARDRAAGTRARFHTDNPLETISVQSEASLYMWEPVATNDRVQPRTSERFEKLKEQWAADTEFASSATEQFMHPAYQQIVGMGRDGLPLILRDLRDNPAHWFWALAAISGEDHADGANTFEEARERWLAWGAREGYLT